MAASAATASSSPGLCPNYAAICSFLERYGALLDLPELTFPQLEQYLRDTAAVPKLLVDLHVKLLRKIGKSVSADRWEKYLVKICQDLNTTWAWELEQNGYKELTTECKTGILKYLCECQFDDNVKFKTAINEEDPEKMRLQPIGRDKDGQMYWFQLDQEDNVRVYLEEQDDLDGSSWRCIVRDRNDLAEVLALLKTQIDPELLKKDQENKPEGEVKKVEDTSDEDVKDAAKAGGPVLPKTEDAEKAPSVDDVKSEAPDAKLSQNGVVEGESRAEPDSEKSAADPGGGAKAPNIKEEPMEEAPPTEARTVAAAASEPVVPETPSLPVKVEKRDEAKKSSAEEIQQALKNDQQAKIPLKKRGMKFSEDFEKNSGGGIIVPNPAAPQVKDAAKAEPPKRAQVVNVNGDVQPAAEKLQSLKDADKEPAAEPAEGKSVETRDKDSPLPREEEEKKEEEEGRKDEAHSAEKNKEDSGKKDPDVPVEPESAAPKGKTEPPKEPALLPGDAAEKPSGQEERRKVKETAKDETSRKTGDSDKESKDVGSRDPEGVKKEEETRAAREAEKGTPGVIKATTTTTACEGKKSADSVSVFLITDAVIKKTDVLKDGGDDAVRKVCEKSGGESVGSSVIKKLDGSRKPAEKHGGAEEAETSRKPVDCEAGTRRDGSKMSADEPGPGEARAAALKEDPKPRDGGKAEDSVTRKRTEETSSCAAEETSAAKGSDTKTEGSDRETKRTEEDVNVETKKDTDKEAIKNADKEKTKDADKEKTKDADKEKTKDADKEKTKDADKELKKDADKEKTKDADKELKKDADKEKIKDADKEKTKDTDKELKKDTEKEKTKDTDKEKTKDTEKELKKDTEKEKTKETEKEKTKETDKEKTKDADKELKKDADKELKKDTDKEKTKDTDKELKKDTDREKTKDTDKEKTKDADKEKTKDADKELKKDTDKEKTKDTDKELKKDTDREKTKDTDKEKTKDADKEKTKDADKEKTKDADKELKKDTDKEKTKDTDKEKTKDTDKEKTKDADKTKDTDKEKDTDVEKPRNGSEKLCPDEENENDSTTEKRSKPDETKANKRALMETETSTKSGKSAPQKASEEVDGKEVGGKEVDGKCSEEAQKDGRPNAVPEAEKPAGEDGKSKSEDEDSAAKKDEVANGGEALTSRRKVRPRGHRRKVRLQREARLEDSESDANTGRSLRRSPRISRPTAKAVEIHDRKLERSQAAGEEEEEEEKDEEAEKEKEKGEEEEEEEEDEVKAVQKKPREKKVFQEGQPKPKGRKRRRVRWSNTRTRRKKKGSEDDDSEESSSEDEEEEEESEDDSDEDYKVERSKKRRNRHRERRSSDSSTSTDDDMPPNDDPCKHCGLPNHPELILLCDSCDSGYHTACLRPPLMIIPDGEWFCSPCQHKLLCDKLEEQLTNLDAALKKKERAERRKERLIYVGISLENIITPGEVEEEKPEIIIKEKKESKRSKSWGRRSTRKKKSISYRFDEFDEAIEEAIEEDIKEAEGGGAGRGKDMANITGHRGKDMSTILQADEGKENVRPPPAPLGPRRKKRRRLNDLDSDSTVDEEESEDEFRISESSEEEFVVSENESEGDSESNSEFDGKAKRRDSSRHKKKSLKRRRSARKRRRPRGYSDDEEEETDEEDEDEMVTEGSSEYSDSDLDMSRRRSRRSQKKRVNYHETSESEGSRAETKQARMRPGRRRDSSDSEASFSKGSEEESRDRRLKRKADSSEEDSRQRRRRLALKRRRASEDDDSSDDSSSEDRPIRKRVNRIDSDDSEEEEEEKKEEKEENAEEEKKQQDGEQKEDKTKEKKTTDEESKGTKLADGDAADGDAAPTNGQKSPVKSSEGAGGRPAAGAAHPDPPKNIGAAPNGQEMAPQDEDEDDLLGVTDLVDYVCNNEDL
ncbi:remodeling and spacing factor 1 [Clinocottus analis]|uniref:remodeling and spacing factor 1 n=1 Tax=Clinocottus analis TaxID=304258 RepID=UPI0035C06895